MSEHLENEISNTTLNPAQNRSKQHGKFQMKEEDQDQRQRNIRENDKIAFTLGVVFIIFTEYLVVCKATCSFKIAIALVQLFFRK